MVLSLDKFVEETKKEVESFEKEYRKRAESMPEIYPLELPDYNSGLWIEFFISYMTSGEL